MAASSMFQISVELWIFLVCFISLQTVQSSKMGLGLGSSCATEWLVISVSCLAGWVPVNDL